MERKKFSSRKSEISELFFFRASKFIHSLKKEKPETPIIKSNITTVFLRSNLFIKFHALHGAKFYAKNYVTSLSYGKSKSLSGKK